jgi:transposase-like protein
MKHDDDGLFTGRSSSMSDILPCPRCYSLKIKKAPNHMCPPWEKRYECKDCHQFFRLDTRLPEDNIVDWTAKEKLNIKLPPM